MTRPSFRLSALAIPCVVFAAACSSYRPPAFEVLRVDEIDRTRDAVVLGFTVSATNPNDEPMPLQRMRYALALDGTRVFEGQRSAETVVRRFGTQTIELPAVVPADRFDPAGFERADGPSYVLSGYVQYQTPGELAEVLFDTGVRRPRAPLSGRGVVELATPAAAP